VSVARRADGRSIIGLSESGFVRLVAPTPTGILYASHYRISDSVAPRPWDLIQVDAPWADNRPAQPENRIVNHAAWQLLERPVSPINLPAFPAPPTEPLFGAATRALPVQRLPVRRSILCIEPQEVEACCHWRHSEERLVTRLRFDWLGARYDLPLLDARWSEVLAKPGERVCTLEQLGCRPHHGLRLIVSLGEPFHGWCYKLISGILCMPAARTCRPALSARASA
jgi:hypothetical protein